MWIVNAPLAIHCTLRWSLWKCASSLDIYTYTLSLWYLVKSYLLSIHGYGTSSVWCTLDSDWFAASSCLTWEFAAGVATIGLAGRWLPARRIACWRSNGKSHVLRYTRWRAWLGILPDRTREMRDFDRHRHHQPPCAGNNVNNSYELTHTLLSISISKE